ncbi:aspartate/glutamate racemase family protein [Aliigemmobacter aestuarii]|uniref:Hydantoin racemase n=1 Tax=Aliigemmobacter aestuarii TaxID=1445661 RepID=A0A4S3MIY0_9RHOB|nr:aspartate/glutamate racemase family protein [Gemmobacter aestuarii]THD80831.1 aspartate/glutamate racemase family protein [Gemmobacter aestuarii]
MNLLILNPNSTASMTDTIAATARRVALPGSRIVAVTGSGTAPASVEGHADAAFAIPAMLAAIRLAEAGGAPPDAIVIACFDDPGLLAAREIACAPVVGIAQAAMQVAMLISARFSIVTTLPRSVPIIEELAHVYGAGNACRRVRSVDIPVLALESAPDAAFARLVAEGRRALAEDGAEAIVLGCAGMAEMCGKLSHALGVPVIDGVVAAVKLAEALAGGGFSTSKAGSLAYPRNKAADAPA